MIPISISSELKHALPELVLGCISARVTVDEHSEPLWQEINPKLVQVAENYKVEDIASIPQIAAMRTAYRHLGKDPSRYRGSAEALLRRVLAGKGLYQVNTLVDINNLVSVESLLPVGSYDIAQVKVPIELRIGRSGETYKGIGKDEVKLENLPVFADEQGAFGSPTSDSERSMIRLETTDLLMVLFSFAGLNEVGTWMERAARLLQQYAGAEKAETLLLSSGGG